MRRRFSAASKRTTDGLKVPHDDLRDREQRHEERDGNAKAGTKGDTKGGGDLPRQKKQRRSTGSWEEPDSSTSTTDAASSRSFLVKPCQRSGSHGSPVPRMAPVSPPAMSRCR